MALAAGSSPGFEHWFLRAELVANHEMWTIWYNGWEHRVTSFGLAEQKDGRSDNYRLISLLSKLAEEIILKGFVMHLVFGRACRQIFNSFA